MNARQELRTALRANAGDLLGYFERRVADREDAADLLGEVFMTAWRRLDGLPEGDPTRQRMWLYGIAARTLSNHHRGRRRRHALIDRLRGELATAPVIAEDTAESLAVRDAVSRLKPALRELVRLVHWDGLTLNEAAEVLDLNPSTARGRYAAARDQLRVALADNPRRAATPHAGPPPSPPDHRHDDGPSVLPFCAALLLLTAAQTTA